MINNGFISDFINTLDLKGCREVIKYLRARIEEIDEELDRASEDGDTEAPPEAPSASKRKKS